MTMDKHEHVWNQLRREIIVYFIVILLIIYLFVV